MIDCQDEIVETIASPVRGVVMVTNKNYFSTTSLKKRFSSLNAKVKLLAVIIHLHKNTTKYE
jgi:hypothetical protein